MKNAERIVMVAIVLALIGGGYWAYSAVVTERKEFRERVAAGEFEIREEPEDIVPGVVPEETQDWRRYYPVTYPMRIGDVKVEASVADTLSERIKGLSDTPYLPPNVVKLFAFGVPGEHSMVMRDMNYALDMLWAAEDGTVVHIVEDISPDTFPQTFSAPTADAWFVVEANAGFVAEHGIELGAVVMIPRGG